MASYYNQVNGLGPKVWYRFDETAGTPTNSGSATSTLTQHFTNLLLNEPTDVDGRSVYSNDGHCRLSQMPEFTLFDDRSFTVETWFKTNQTFLSSRTDSYLWSLRGRTSNLSLANNSVAVALFNLQIFGGTYGVVADRYKIQFNTIIGNLSDTPVTIKSSATVVDDKWHHVVAVVNTTSVKLYLDGQLVGTGTPPSATRFYLDNSASHFGINYKVIGAFDTNNASSYKGWIDEFAGYDYELSAQQVLDNFNAGASVEFADAPGTASALSVQPTLITDGIHNAAPMTASSASGDHYNSTVDFPKMLEAYLSEFSLEQWYKFDNPGIVTNYGTGGIVGSSMNYNGTISNVMHGGIQGSGALKATNGPAYLVQAFGANEPYSTEVTDHEFALGFWIKADTNYNNRSVFRYYNAFDAQNHYYDAIIGTGGTITFRSKGTQEANVTYGTAIDDNAWHFVYIEASAANNLIRISVDNSAFVTATTIAANRPTGINTFTLGNTNTSTNGELLLSHYFIGAYGLMDSTARGNVLTYEDTVIQGSARMPEPIIKFSNKFNDLVASYNPKIEFRLDEPSDLPFNFGQTGISIAKVGTNVTYSEPTQNRFAYKFTNANTYFSGDYTYPSGTFSTGNKQTMLAVFKTSNARAYEQIIGSMGMFGFLGAGITLAITTSGHLTARVNRGFGPTDTEAVNYNTNVCDGAWHFAAVVRDGSNLTLYVDGKQRAQKTNCVITLSDTATWGISAEAKFNSQGSAAKDLWIDEFAVLADEFSAQEVFELWQSLNIDGAMIANNATLPMPTNIAGTGTTHSAEPHLATADLIMPGQEDELNNLALPASAHSDFVMPNFGATSVINVNYGHTAATADALFHDPQIQVGEFIGVDHMDASALFVHPISTGGGKITVSTAVGGPAELVMPGIITIKGAQVFAEPALANSFLPLPPAYLQLTDDQWYVRLFAQHAEQNIEPAFVTGSLQNTASTQVAKTFLKFFDDVTSTITVGNGYLENNLEEKIFLSPGSTNTTKTKVYPSIAPNLTPTPALYTGYFDDFSRKAVRVNNIEFEMPEEIYKSQLPFSLEFSIKTTKANQIIAKGKWKSFLYTQKLETGFGLYNGKLYLMNSNTTSGVPGNRTPHPANPDMAGNPFMIGRKNIADGQWHHIIVQIGYTDNRIQFWVDGQLDRQQIGGGQQFARLYVMGSNNAITTYQSDFETSAWSYDKQAFISEQDVDLNYIGYLKYEPIKAEPMKATITMTANNTATGNRGRAIVFYFWPEDTDGIIARNPLEITNPGGPTFDPVVSTDDYFRQPPQQWYDWDLYPVDVTGRYVSELVKPEAYGIENIKIQEPSFTILTGKEDPAKYAYKVNTRGYFTDPVTDARRYIDVFNDIDLSQFDAIFFKNYPEESIERDAYTREDFADEYFNLRERELFDKFLVSLRKGLDTGISLFVTNHQLAIDLGIVDRVEDVNNIHEGDFATTDAYVAARITPNGAILPRTSGDYLDLHKNNRHRVVNTLENLTNEPGYIWKDWFYFENDDTVDYGGPNRPYTKIEYRPNGLQVGDEFIISDERLRASYSKAAPIANVKAGKVITAFSNQILQNNTAIDNPFKNYATTIAVEPGTILNGKPTVGKIFVTFTEGFDREDKDYTREYFGVDLIQDEFINRAYQDGEISLDKRNELLASPDNLDRQLEAAIIAGNQTLINGINKLKYWTSNGDYILTQKTLLDDPTGSGVQQDGLGKGVRKGRVNRVNKKGAFSTQSVSSSLQWFALTYAYQFERAQFVAASMLTRGIRWLSDKVIDEGNVNRVEVARISTSELVMPIVTADKDRTVYAASMLANANILHAPGYALADVSNTTLPLTANAKFGDFVKNINADVFNASSLMKDPRISGIEEDEVVVYMIHVDPILYLREDIIK
jgi:hypothetical protein